MSSSIVRSLGVILTMDRGTKQVFTVASGAQETSTLQRAIDFTCKMPRRACGLPLLFKSHLL
jgi:hypothetical protein